MQNPKAQMAGDVLKYLLIIFASSVILIAGYMTVNTVKDRACKAEIGKFEIDLHGIEQNLRFGQKELMAYNAPCGVDQIYFFDKNKEVNPEIFDDNPIIRNSIESKSQNNIFLVNGYTFCNKRISYHLVRDRTV